MHFSWFYLQMTHMLVTNRESLASGCVSSIWTASSEFGTYRLCEQRRFRRACASAQSRQNLRCSLIQAVSLEEPSDRNQDPWPFWMTGHAQLKFIMTECSKTQIRLTGLKYNSSFIKSLNFFFFSVCPFIQTWYEPDMVRCIIFKWPKTSCPRIKINAGLSQMFMDCIKNCPS